MKLKNTHYKLFWTNIEKTPKNQKKKLAECFKSFSQPCFFLTYGFFLRELSSSICCCSSGRRMSISGFPCAPHRSPSAMDISCTKFKYQLNSHSIPRINGELYDADPDPLHIGAVQYGQSRCVHRRFFFLPGDLSIIKNSSVVEP